MEASSPTEATQPTKVSLMESLLGLLRIHVKRGVNLAVRDVRTSDPYVVVKMGSQRLKTRVIKKDVNPEWKEDLTLSVTDPSLPVKLIVYDHDTFSKDDKMGDAEFERSEDEPPLLPERDRVNPDIARSGKLPLGGELPPLEPREGDARHVPKALERGVRRGRDPAAVDRSPRLQRSIGNSGPPPFNT